MSRMIRAVLATLVFGLAAYEPATLTASETTTSAAATTLLGDGVVTISYNGYEINIWPNGQIQIWVPGLGQFIFYPDGSYLDFEGNLHWQSGELTLTYIMMIITFWVGQVIIP